MRRSLFPLLCLLAVLSCREPSSVENYVCSETGPFSFNVDMSDTSAVYDLVFYTRLDGRHRDIESDVEMPLSVWWRSPSDSLYQEEVYLPLEGEDETYYSRQLRVPYREGVKSREPGWWNLTVTLPSPVPGFRGLGLIVEKKRLWDMEN